MSAETPFALVILVPVALLAMWVGFRLLRFLNRRLRLFTRGTMTFMTVSLVSFTVIDLLCLGHTIRNDDILMRRESTQKYVCHAIRVMTDDEGSVPLISLTKGPIADLISEERDYINRQIAAEHGKGTDIDDFDLISVKVRHNHSIRNLVGSKVWNTRAILTSGCDTLVIDGRVHTRKDEQGRPQITRMSMEFPDETQVSGRDLDAQYRHHSQFKRVGYKYDRRKKQFCREG